MIGTWFENYDLNDEVQILRWTGEEAAKKEISNGKAYHKPFVYKMLIVNTSKQQPSIFNFLTKKNRNDKDFRYCISCWRNDKFSFRSFVFLEA